jgi:hypothetical protein
VAFPGTYNFNYYQGDTLEFKVYPKTSTGSAFPGLSTYTAQFTIANARGTGRTVAYQGYTRIESDHIICAITPDLIIPSGTWVYDVEISKTQASPYSLVYTLLTGSMSVTEQVTTGEFEAPLQTPGPVINVTATANSQTEATVSWQAPTTGGTVQNYVVTYALAAEPSNILGTTTKTSVELNHQFTELAADTAYIFGVYATNSATQGTPTSVTAAATTLPPAPTAPTDLTVTGTTNTTIVISWAAPSSGNQTGYVMYLDGAQGEVLSSTDTGYTFVGLSPETTYLIGIQAINVGGGSNIVTTTTQTQAN